MERSGLEGLISYAADTGEGSVELDFEVENINKANVIFEYTTKDENGNTKTEELVAGEASYEENWKLKLTAGENIPNTITLTNSETVFYDKNENTITDLQSVYNSINIELDELIAILNNNSTITITQLSAENNAENFDTYYEIKKADDTTIKITKKYQEIDDYIYENGEVTNVTYIDQTVELEVKYYEIGCNLDGEGNTIKVDSDGYCYYVNVNENGEEENCYYKDEEGNNISEKDYNFYKWCITDNNGSRGIDVINLDFEGTTKIQVELANLKDDSNTELNLSFVKCATGIQKTYITDDTIAKIISELTIDAGNLVDQTYTQTYTNTYKATTYLLRTTRASLETETTTLFYDYTSNAELTINLHTEEEQYELFNNPNFILVIPSTIQLDKDDDFISIENSQDFTIAEASGVAKSFADTIEKISDCNAVAFSLSGEQKEWTDYSDENTKVNLTLNLTPSSDATEAAIRLYYINGTNTQNYSTFEEIDFDIYDEILATLSMHSEAVTIGNNIEYTAFIRVLNTEITKVTAQMNLEGLKVNGVAINGVAIDEENYTVDDKYVNILLTVEDGETIQNEFEIIIDLSTDNYSFDGESKTIEQTISLTNNNNTYSSDPVKITISKTSSSNGNSSTTTDEELYSSKTTSTETADSRDEDYGAFISTTLTHPSIDSAQYFCRQKGGAMPCTTYKSSGTVEYKGESDKGSDWYAYYYSWIFSEKYSKVCHSRETVQNAIWATSLNLGTQKSWNSLNYTASDYATYKKNYVTPKFNKKTTTYNSVGNDETLVVGPYNVSYNVSGNFGGIASIKLYKDNGETEIEAKYWSITNKNGTSIDIKPNTDFYISFKNVNTLTDDGVTKPILKITFKPHYSTYAKITNLYSNTVSVKGAIYCENCGDDEYRLNSTKASSITAFYPVAQAAGHYYRDQITYYYYNGVLKNTVNGTLKFANAAPLKWHCFECGSTYSYSDTSFTCFGAHYKTGCTGTLTKTRYCYTFVHYKYYVRRLWCCYLFW